MQFYQSRADQSRTQNSGMADGTVTQTAPTLIPSYDGQF